MDPETLIQSWSYVGIIAFLVLTGCGLPIPEEVPIIAAGILSSRGTLNPWLALASCLVGAIVGDIVMYGFGRKFGRSLLQRRGYLHSLLSAEREQEIEEKFRKHGMKVLFAARFLAGIRSPIYITAGILKVPFRRFVIADTFCALIVIPLFFGAAYYFSTQFETIWRWVKRGEIAATVIAVIGSLIAYCVYCYMRKRKAAEHATDEEGKSARSSSEMEKSVA
jgi:membrane protein DedA with SNARE-associated domain